MTEFFVYVTATYQAEESHSVKIEANDKYEAQEIAQKLAENGKFIGDHEWLATSGSVPFQIYNAQTEVEFSAEVEGEVEEISVEN